MKRILALLAFVIFATSVSGANSCGDTNHVCTLDTNISTSTSFIDGNTYVLLQDINVTGSSTVLTIAPGAVIKPLANRSLIAIDGGRIVANGTADKNIIFTSCKDQNSYTGSTNADTSTVSGCSGATAFSDYNTGIWVRTASGMTRSDSLSFLKILNAKVGIRLDQNIDSIHDSNFWHVGATAAAFGINFVGGDANIYNNTFSDVNTGYGINVANQ
ncbi:MAG: hypothetical protein Q7R47_04575, partial [Candidatus Diapherotrites archaeon]|nr:hypothetical protein [Candidatus Diapherotrites archaeon]